jgi:signal transduction histidine kinase
MLWSPPSANPIGHDLLVKKGNELHLLILLTSLVYAVVYGVVDFYLGLNLQAFVILGFALITLTNLALFRRGWINTSKILNLLTVSAIIAGISWITGQETMVLAFFVPIIISTLIVFQGAERKKGYALALLTFIFVVLWMRADIKSAIYTSFTREQLHTEWLMNLVGVIVVTVLEVLYILVLSNRIQNELLEKSRDLEQNNTVLERTIEVRNRMLKLLSHDIRSPLHLIEGNLGLMQQGRLDVEDKQLIELLQERTRGTLLLIDNLLAWTRAQTDILHYEPVPVALETIGNRCREHFKLLNTKNLQLSIHCEGAISVHADPAMLETIARNLLSNAIKFSPPGSEIRITTEKKAAHVRIAFEDDGVGMSPDVLNKLQQGEALTLPGQAKEKGHGIGLQLVQELLLRHGSKLEIASQPGKGSQFSFTLPFAENAHP